MSFAPLSRQAHWLRRLPLIAACRPDDADGNAMASARGASPMAGSAPPHASGDADRAADRDATAARQEYLFAPPAAIRKRITSCLSDPRDAPIAFLFLNVALLTLPGAALVFWSAAHTVGATYLLLNYAAFLQRFMLALHYSEHRRLFAGGEHARCPAGGRGIAGCAGIRTAQPMPCRRLVSAAEVLPPAPAAPCRLRPAQHVPVAGAGALLWPAQRHVLPTPLRDPPRGGEPPRR